MWRSSLVSRWLAMRHLPSCRFKLFDTFVNRADALRSISSQRRAGSIHPVIAGRIQVQARRFPSANPAPPNQPTGAKAASRVFCRLVAHEWRPRSPAAFAVSSHISRGFASLRRACRFGWPAIRSAPSCRRSPLRSLLRWADFLARLSRLSARRLAFKIAI